MRHHSADAFATPVEDEAAAYALALSARHFTHRTKSLVDDKLTFSATLMRAGEVTAAGRAMAEFEDDMRTESAALMDQVRELKAGHAGRCRHRTRSLLARLLATAMVGMSLLSVSVAGAAVAGYVFDGSPPPTGGVRQGTLHAGVEGVAKYSPRTVRMPTGARVKLGGRELRTYRQLMRGATVDSMELEAFFEALPPDVAVAVRQMLTATGVLSREQAEVVDALLDKAKAGKADTERRAAQEAESGEEAAGEPQESETEDDSATDSSDKADKGERPSNGGDADSSVLPELPLGLPTP